MWSVEFSNIVGFLHGVDYILEAVTDGMFEPRWCPLSLTFPPNESNRSLYILRRFLHLPRLEQQLTPFPTSGNAAETLDSIVPMQFDRLRSAGSMRHRTRTADAGGIREVRGWSTSSSRRPRDLPQAWAVLTEGCGKRRRRRLLAAVFPSSRRRS